MADDQGPNAPHAGAEESLAFLEEMDAASDRLAAVRARPRSSDPETQRALARLSQHQLSRLVRVLRGHALPPPHHLALVTMLGSGAAESLRDDELVEMARIAAEAPPAEDVLAGSRWSEIVEATAAWGALPSVPIFVPTRERGAQEIMRLKPGSVIAVIGGTGSGKTSLALEMARLHAVWTGPAAFFGLELAIAETGARLVGQHHGVGWIDAASLGTAELQAALDVPRAHAFGRLPLAAIEARIDAMFQRYPGLPLFVVIDYAQILQDDMTERLAFAAVLERLRLLVQRTQCICVLTSQGSRQSSRALRDGSKLGKDTEDAGAESAQLERMAYATLALGGDGEDDGHGWRPVDLSIGKARMGQGDVVVPMTYHGKSGRFAYAGVAEKAKDVRVRRAAEKELRDRKVSDERDEQRVREFLQDQDGPVARSRVEHEAGGRKDANVAALRRMMKSGEVVEVGDAARPGWKPPVMLRTGLESSSPSSPSLPADHPTGHRGHRTITIPLQDRRSWGDDGGDDLQDGHGGGGVDQVGEVEEPWEPNAQHRTFAAARGIDLDALVEQLHTGPRVRDPDAALMAALMRAAADPNRPRQTGFLGIPVKPKT